MLIVDFVIINIILGEGNNRNYLLVFFGYQAFFIRFDLDVVGDVFILVRVIGSVEQMSLGDWMYLFGVDLQLVVVDYGEDQFFGSDVELYFVGVVVLIIIQMELEGVGVIF